MEFVIGLECKSEVEQKAEHCWRGRVKGERQEGQGQRAKGEGISARPCQACPKPQRQQKSRIELNNHPLPFSTVSHPFPFWEHISCSVRSATVSFSVHPAMCWHKYLTNPSFLKWALRDKSWIGLIISMSLTTTLLWQTYVKEINYI